MWLEMKHAKRRKLLNMSESKHATTGKSRTQRSVERLAVLLAASTPTISKLLHRHSFTKPMERTNLTWLTSCCNCGCSGGSTMRCNVCFGDLFPRWANITKAEICSSGRFFPRWAKTTRAAREDPMTASLNALGFTWLTMSLLRYAC